MASSRIFVKGLPPTFTDAEFQKHFSQNREVTDAKIFPSRRIGYVGYKTPEDAQKAVKYFNKTFIRMSRIGVELARPVQDALSVKRTGGAPTAKAVAVDSEAKGQAGGAKRKRASQTPEREDPKLKEFLDVMKPKTKRKGWESEGVVNEEGGTHPEGTAQIIHEDAAASDDEYEDLSKQSKRAKMESQNSPAKPSSPRADREEKRDDDAPINSAVVSGEQPEDASAAEKPLLTDSDWARSRTSRLLGLLDDDEEEAAVPSRQKSPEDNPVKSEKTKLDEPVKVLDRPLAVEQLPDSKDANEADEPADGEPATMRLFLRNLPYNVDQQAIEAEFAHYGHLEDIHVPVDSKTGLAKGFAYIQFSEQDAAEQAMQEKDGQPFQGRLLHILPATAKRESKMDDFELSKLPLKKQQQIKKRREAASATFNWNALYMNADAVVSSVADRLGLSKSDVLDPTSSDAAVKQAHAETHIIQETKAYFKQQGVDLDAFKKSQRGDTAILVKNIPYDCSKDELKRLFEEHGEVKRFLMPPSATLAIVEFANSAQCKLAFGALAYRKIKSSVLFLEKAPKGLFDADAISSTDVGSSEGITKTSASELKDANYVVPESGGSATLFVRNLNFGTTNQVLSDTFKPLDGFISARVKTKTDPKKPGQILSMGFGFLEFRSSAQAQSALKAMDGYNLDGHKLQIRASHKGADAAEERRKADAEKRAAGKKTKVVIKNLPFETTKKDVRALFGAYGQLRSVRVPKKMDRGARGFAFAEFTTPKEAENAIDALKDTHLLGRRLVLDFAAEDPEDAEAEIEKMQQKVGAQVNKVALQNLTGAGRKKFSTLNDEEMEV